MKTSESISKLAAALLKAQSNMGNATKDSKNPFFKSSYADLNSIRDVVTPALNANGITLLQPITSLDGKSFVETVLLHESGEFMSSLTEIVVAKQNDPQAAGSGISYARRYGLQSFLSVGAADDDGEASMGRGKPAPAFSKPEPKPEPAPVKVEAKVEAPKPAPAPLTPAAVTTSAAPAAVRKPFNKPMAPVAVNPVSNGSANAADFD